MKTKREEISKMARNILEIHEDEITMTNCGSAIFGRKIRSIEGKITDIDFIKKAIKNKLILVLEDEEVYIKYLTLPKVEEDTLERMIIEEFKYYYKLKEDICFSYSILNKNEYNMEIVLFYINSKKLNNLNMKGMKKVKAVYLLQFCVMEYLKRFSNIDENYILCFNYKKNIYFLLCNKGMLKANYTEKILSVSKAGLEQKLDRFVEMNKGFGSLIKLYILGFKKETLNSLDLKYEYEDLGEINKAEFFSMLV